MPPPKRKPPRRPPGGASLLPKPKKPYGIGDSAADTIARARPIDGKAFGVDRGLGVYRGKGGHLTYKGTGKGSPGVRGDAGAPSSTKPAGSPSPTKPGAKGTPVIAGDPFTEGILQQGREQIADIGAYNQAAAEILKGVGTSIRGGYSDAASNIGKLGAGFTGALGTDLAAAGQATSDKIRQAQGNYLTPEQYARVAGAASPKDTQDIAYLLGAYLPATNLEETGAAFGAAADFLPGARLQEGAYAIDSAQKATREEVSKARSQAAAQSAKDAQWKMEFALKQRKLNADIAEAKADGKLDRAKLLQSQKDREFDRWYKREGLRIREQNDKLDAQAAAARGQEVDASASKAAGYLVDQTGQPILNRSGKRIKVTKTAGSKPSPGNSGYQKAVTAAEDLRGEPIENTSALQRGAYIADDKASGADVYTGPKGRTTDNPRKAKYDSQYTFAEAVNILMQTYGVTRAQARKALITRGWKPEKKKPTYPKPVGPGGGVDSGRR